MIRLENIQLSYHKPLIINGSMELPGSSITAIIGKSGLGKTTLLNQIGFIDEKWSDHLDYYFNDELLNGKNVLPLYKNNYFYLFQNNNLVDEMTCFDNIIFLATMRGIRVTKEEILKIFDTLQVDIDLTQYPTQISGGQRQKLEIAILAVIRPKVILCDEITSALDGISALEIFALLKQIVHDIHATCVMVVHDPKIIDRCDHIYELKNQQLHPIRLEKNQEKIELAPIKPMSLKTYLAYAVLKLTNIQFLKQSIVIGVLFSFMITSFNLIYRYNHDNKLKLADSLLHVDCQEFVFDCFDGLSFEATPYEQKMIEINNQSLSLTIGASKSEIENHLLITNHQTGAYINLYYADLLGIHDDQSKQTIQIEDQEYTIAGVVDNDYMNEDQNYAIFFTNEDQLILPSDSYSMMMYYEEDIHQIEKIDEEIRAHDLEIYSSLKDHSDHLQQNKKINFFIDLLLGAVVMILVVFAVIYSIIQYEAKKKEITLLYNRGFRLGSLSFLNFSENLGVLGMIIVISPIVTQLISNSLVLAQVFYTKENMLGIYILISFLTALLVFGLSQFMISFIYMNVRRRGK